MAEKARILKGVGGLFTAALLPDEDCGAAPLIECRAKGGFRREGIKPLPGDLVEIERQRDGTGFIVEICPRKNELIRPAGANIDLMILVAATAKPSPDLFLIDKLLAVAAYHKIDALLLFNKADLCDAAALCRIYNLSGYDAVPFSALSAAQDTVDHVRRAARGKVCFFAGVSGVGKSSSINVLFPELGARLETGGISRKIERGKHTTRKTELYMLPDGTYIADTPGFSMLEIARYNMIPQKDLVGAFPDIDAHAHACRYTDCTHLCEDGCGVLDAVRNGLIAQSRHESYRNLFEELKTKHEWD